MSVSSVFVLFHYLLWKVKLDLSALSKGSDLSHINVLFSTGYCLLWCYENPFLNYNVWSQI